MGGEILTTAEVAELLGVSVATLKMWRADGRGPTFFRLTTTKRPHIRYHRKDIDAWIEEMKNTHEETP